MPMSPPKACRRCQKATMDGQLCSDCRKTANAETNDARKSDEVRKMYQNSNWRKFRLAILACNSICQALELNPMNQRVECCRSAADTIHHLRSPRTRPDLFLKASNVIALCANHHAKTEGEPDGERDPAKYVATKFRDFAQGGRVVEVN
jgi:hypothetical protein